MAKSQYFCYRRVARIELHMLVQTESPYLLNCVCGARLTAAVKIGFLMSTVKILISRQQLKAEKPG